MQRVIEVNERPDGTLTISIGPASVPATPVQPAITSRKRPYKKRRR